MYAVIKTGGKQYRVAKDDVITVERLEGDAGGKIEFPEVLMVGGRDDSLNDSPFDQKPGRAAKESADPMSDLSRQMADAYASHVMEMVVAQATPGGIFMHEPNAVMHHFVPMKRLTWSYFLSRCLAEGYSKAMVSRFVGPEDGLSSERSYVLTILTTVISSSGRPMVSVWIQYW